MKTPIPLRAVIARLLQSGVPNPKGRGPEYAADFHRAVRELYAGNLLIVTRDTSVSPPNVDVVFK